MVSASPGLIWVVHISMILDPAPNYLNEIHLLDIWWLMYGGYRLANLFIFQLSCWSGVELMVVM